MTSKFKLLIVIFASILALILTEVLFRVTIPKPENLVKLERSVTLLHENNPSTEFEYGGTEFNTSIKINSYGFRDNEFKIEKANDVYRIAVLGDSQEEALQVNLDDTWQKIMARILSENLESDVETYNFGVSGYGIDQNWINLSDKIWQFSPDMVILAFSPNDLGDTYKNNLVRLENNSLVRVSAKERASGNIIGNLARETYMYHIIVKAASASDIGGSVIGYLRTKILGFSEDDRFYLSDAQLIDGPFEVIASKENPPKEVSDAWAVVRALIIDMNNQTLINGAEFLITIDIPGAQVEDEDWENIRGQYHLDPGKSSAYKINNVLSKIAQDNDIDFYDPRLDARQWIKGKGIIHFPVDRHFNENGHYFMGDRVASFIIEKDLITF